MKFAPKQLLLITKRPKMDFFVSQLHCTFKNMLISERGDHFGGMAKNFACMFHTRLT